MRYPTVELVLARNKTIRDLQQEYRAQTDKKRIQVMEEMKRLGVTFTHSEKPGGEWFIEAHKGPEEVAKCSVWVRGSRAQVGDVHVNPAWRRKGIATAMYIYAEEITTTTLAPAEGEDLSDDAAGLWDQPERPFGS
jgi:GNAT superfamily N-acetyltransferase